MPEFKVTQGSRAKRQDTTIAIGISDLAKFTKIKGFLSFKSGRNVESTEVMHELIEAWILKNGVLGDSN